MPVKEEWVVSWTRLADRNTRVCDSCVQQLLIFCPLQTTGLTEPQCSLIEGSGNPIH